MVGKHNSVLSKRSKDPLWPCYCYYIISREIQSWLPHPVSAEQFIVIDGSDTSHLLQTHSATNTPTPHSNMFLFGLGRLVYVAVLITNAIAILSEDRFLARSTSSRLPFPPPLTSKSDLPANQVTSIQSDGVAVKLTLPSAHHTIVPASRLKR